ncbi:UNVERIFIED_CONTAM: hypothetical protein Sradi_0934400 [Sesamum radiatum]|uniref:DUF3741 domain-containing protein n=1 Tax=Sesamum radiatum TaxID=300843 RepID=A0AAW2V3Q6_SESRA
MVLSAALLGKNMLSYLNVGVDYCHLLVFVGLVCLVRLRQASKKFGGDEKQPKLRLIADENSGGFPTAKNNNGATNNDDHEQKHETRVPGLVARLMGLESMPALQREKSRKVLASGFVSGKAEKFVVDDVREEVTVEKVGIKHELRPQKLQRTSVSERLPITRLGSEKLPFKNVLSKSRKHHPKLPSPVKSPRHIPRKNSSKLIGAATRILEPGLQTSRLKCALTYSNTLHHPPHNTVVEERTHVIKPLEGSDGSASVDPKGPPCRNCGYLLDRPRASEQPLVFASPSSHCVGSSCQGLERSKPGNSAFYQELGEDCLRTTRQLQLMLLTIYNLMLILHHMLRARDIVPPRSKLNSSTSSKVSTQQDERSKDFVSAIKALVPGRGHLSDGQCEAEDGIREVVEKRFQMIYVVITVYRNHHHKKTIRRARIYQLHLMGEIVGVIKAIFLSQHLSQFAGYQAKQKSYFQTNVMAVKLSFDQHLESEHPSPGSVLETQFSTESCPSGSLDETQGYKPLSESLCCSYHGPRLPTLDSELFDSAASTKTTDTGKELVIDILNNVSEILCCSDLAICGLKGDKLDQAKEVLVNAELVFHNAGLSEHLGSRLEGYPKAGSKVSRKLPLRMNTTNTLIFEIVDIVRRWEDLSRFGLDELIEKEMTRSLGEWTQCENEAFETGMEISRHVFQVLLDETVRDLWN